MNDRVGRQLGQHDQHVTRDVVQLLRVQAEFRQSRPPRPAAHGPDTRPVGREPHHDGSRNRFHGVPHSLGAGQRILEGAEVSAASTALGTPTPRDEKPYAGVGQAPEPTVGVGTAAKVRDRRQDHGVQVGMLRDAREEGVGPGAVVGDHLGQAKLPPPAEVAEDPGQSPLAGRPRGDGFTQEPDHHGLRDGQLLGQHPLPFGR
ncbi:hypothetical protein [Kitasatospora sp. NPDC101183]|uniref:hypothetical protein n=1 Tax=Kitasatospora sp. NPDC101183 TaxID=3364100 RepID=UPI00381C58EC